MTVRLTGRGLDRDELARVARGRERVELDASARARMDETRAIVVAAVERGDPIYGTTTAVGVLKRVSVPTDGADAYASRMIRHHLVGHGPIAPTDVVRATMLRLANHLAETSAGVRPELAERRLRNRSDRTARGARIPGEKI